MNSESTGKLEEGGTGETGHALVYVWRSSRAYESEDERDFFSPYAHELAEKTSF